MVGEGVGEMAMAIILTSTSTVPGRDIPASAAIIRSFFMVAARLGMQAAASTAVVEAFTVVVEAFTVAAEEDTAVAVVIVE
jgi:hypothetical protein